MTGVSRGTNKSLSPLMQFYSVLKNNKIEEKIKNIVIAEKALLSSMRKSIGVAKEKGPKK